MIKDSERGLGYLMGHEDPQTKAQRLRDLNRQIRGAVTPLSDPMDVFTSLPLATEVNLGTRNSLATPEITSPVKPKRKGPTQREIYKGTMEWARRPKLTEQEKEFWGAWNNSDKMLKYVKKHTDDYAGDEERFNDKIQEQDRKPIHQQLTDLKNWDQKNKERFHDRIQQKKHKTISTPIGKVKVINSTQKDITNNKQRRKI